MARDSGSSDRSSLTWAFLLSKPLTSPLYAWGLFQVLLREHQPSAEASNSLPCKGRGKTEKLQGLRLSQPLPPAGKSQLPDRQPCGLEPEPRNVTIEGAGQDPWKHPEGTESWREHPLRGAKGRTAWQKVAQEVVQRSEVTLPGRLSGAWPHDLISQRPSVPNKGTLLACKAHPWTPRGEAELHSSHPSSSTFTAMTPKSPREIQEGSPPGCGCTTANSGTCSFLLFLALCLR